MMQFITGLLTFVFILTWVVIAIRLIRTDLAIDAEEAAEFEALQKQIMAQTAKSRAFLARHED
jgi:hypothetical protein